MADFVKALKVPFSSIKTLAIGVLIGAIPVVNLLLLGFGLSEAQRELRGKKKRVKWWHMHPIAYNSLASFAIASFYFSPFFLFTLFFLTPVTDAFAKIAGESMLLELALWGANPVALAKIFAQTIALLEPVLAENAFFALAALLLAFLPYYVLPFALVNFARKKKAIAAFEWKTLKKAFSAKNFLYWLLFHFYLLALFSVISLLFFSPALNFLVAGSMLFVFFTTGFNLFAQLFSESI